MPKRKTTQQTKAEIEEDLQKEDLEEAFGFFAELHADEPSIAAASAAAAGLNKPEDASDGDDEEPTNKKSEKTKEGKKEKKSKKSKSSSVEEEVLIEEPKKEKKSKKSSKESVAESNSSEKAKKASKKKSSTEDDVAEAEPVVKGKKSSKKSKKTGEEDEEEEKSEKKKSKKTASKSEETVVEEDKEMKKKRKKSKEMEEIGENKTGTQDIEEDQEETAEENGSGNSKQYPRGKAPPEGYVCNACKSGGHWIFDCSKYFEMKKQKKATKNTGGDENAGDVDEDEKAKKRAKKEAAKPAAVAAVVPEKKPKEAPITEPNDDVIDTKVFVQGLPFNITNFKLHQFFQEKAGPVKAINLITFDDSKRCKGMAYVIFNDKETCAKAVALNNEKMGERWLSISYAKVKPDVKKSSFGGGGGGSGGGTRCYRCGGMGHTPQTCTKERICYRCKSTTHLSSDCPMKKSANANHKKFDE